MAAESVLEGYLHKLDDANTGECRLPRPSIYHLTNDRLERSQGEMQRRY